MVDRTKLLQNLSEIEAGLLGTADEAVAMTLTAELKKHLLALQAAPPRDLTRLVGFSRHAAQEITTPDDDRAELASLQHRTVLAIRDGRPGEAQTLAGQIRAVLGRIQRSKDAEAFR